MLQHDPQHSSFGVLKRRGQPSCSVGITRASQGFISVSPAVPSLLEVATWARQPERTTHAARLGLCQSSGTYGT